MFSDFEAILDAMKQREETAKQNNGGNWAY